MQPLQSPRIARNWTKVGLKHSDCGHYDGYTRDSQLDQGGIETFLENESTKRFIEARNWTKVGLKHYRAHGNTCQFVPRNWTKVGLKQDKRWCRTICPAPRNWTKVGLKHSKKIIV